jgi:hypothetical protein
LPVGAPESVPPWKRPTPLAPLVAIDPTFPDETSPVGAPGPPASDERDGEEAIGFPGWFLAIAPHLERCPRFPERVRADRIGRVGSVFRERTILLTARPVPKCTHGAVDPRDEAERTLGRPAPFLNCGRGMITRRDPPRRGDPRGRGVQHFDTCVQPRGHSSSRRPQKTGGTRTPRGWSTRSVPRPLFGKRRCV